MSQSATENLSAAEVSFDHGDYKIDGVDQIFSPGLVLFHELMEHNIHRVLELVGGPDRLRPHCKTHKMSHVIRWQLELGITRQKCATIAEAEMVASCGVTDILIAYPLVGPNLARLGKLMDKFPRVRFMTLADHPNTVEALSVVASASRGTLDVLLDLETGMGRTGIALGPQAIELYEMIATAPGLEPAGLHWYDGHHRQSDSDERRQAVLLGWEHLVSFRDKLLMSGLPVPRIVTAGSGSFAILAQTEEPNLELSPGTITFFDADFAERFPEIGLKIAAGIISHVVSVSPLGTITLDVGHKSCGADQPAGHRLSFPMLTDARERFHSEEHLVVETGQWHQFNPGDAMLVFPRHVCPTVAVHQFATVIAGGRPTDHWPIDARDRVLTI